MIIQKLGEMKMIRNVIFDLGGVILKEKPVSVLKKMTNDSKDSDIIINFFKNWSQLDLGKQTLEEKYNQCNFSEIIDKKYKESLLHFYKYREINVELLEMIKGLKEQQYHLYILSDNIKEANEYYKSHKLLQIFDGWIVSCDYGAIKEDGKLFEILMNKYLLNSNECYFVDDSEVNIKMAERYGIKGHLFKGNEDIEVILNEIVGKSKF